MSSINIYKENGKVIINNNEEPFLFNLEMLMNIINENDTNKIVLLDLPSSLATQICKLLNKNGFNAKSYNAFTNKSSKYIIKLKQKENNKVR